MGLLLAQGFENPFATLFNAVLYNFYPILALAMVLIVIFTKKDLGYKQGEKSSLKHKIEEILTQWTLDHFSEKH